MKMSLLFLLAGAAFIAAGCWTLTVKHKIEPIYITMDVNVKVEKQLNDFFDYEDQAVSPGATAAPVDSTLNSRAKEK